MTQRSSTKFLRRWLAEPLVQFLLAGAVLLTAQTLIAPAGAQAVSGEQIIVSAPAVEAMKAAFAQENGRAPDEAEIRDMITKHVDGEVLYREAIRYGLDRTDVIVRREMQRKMRFLIEDVTPLPEPGHEELRAWLDSHAADYARPQRISFQQVFLGRARHGQDIEYNAGRILAELRAEPESFRRLSDPFPAGQVVEAADQGWIEKHYGRELAQAVFQLEQGQWQQPIRSSLGLHIVRITGRIAPEAVTVEQAGKRLVADYQAAQREQANRRALEKLRARYEISIEDES